MKRHVFVGFGFGPIQAGLFVNEAFKSGNFDRIVIAEIDRELAETVRANNGTYYVNVASEDGVKPVKVEGIEIYDPSLDKDRKKLLQALCEATEIVTSLPSVDFHDTGDNGAASLIARGLTKGTSDAVIVYTAENNNRAAEILEEKVKARTTNQSSNQVQYLNTVIGKMSQVVTDHVRITQSALRTIAPGLQRAFLVEEFNKILVSRCRLSNFEPGIKVFIEKDDLLPFEEAKLYGHNAVHALLAYLGALKDRHFMSELRQDASIMKIARNAFLEESGAALIRKYSNLSEPLFTRQGYEDYAEDLLKRMTNRHFSDTIARAARDPIRKLGYDDRIFGTMRLALAHGIEPSNMALAAAAAIAYLLKKADHHNLPVDFRSESVWEPDSKRIEKLLRWIWKGPGGPDKDELIRLTHRGVLFLASSDRI